MTTRKAKHAKYMREYNNSYIYLELVKQGLIRKESIDENKLLTATDKKYIMWTKQQRS